MRNFFRLLRFAWPYRGKFVLSLVCAMLVAVLWSVNISAVYPLLNILFYHQNCKNWMAEKIVAIEGDVAASQARIDELKIVVDLSAKGGAAAALKLRYDRLSAENQERQADLGRAEDAAARKALEDRAGPGGGLPPRVAPGPIQTQAQVARAQLDELTSAARLYNEGRLAEASPSRLASLERERDSAEWWLARYRSAQPFVNRWLPDNGFQTLVLLIGFVMLSVALKGVFLFLQEVFVAQVTQLTLFGIRNHFYRKTLALDLARFGDQGSADLMARFTSDMDSVSQGLNTVLGKVIREPLRAVGCLSAAMWLNWRLTLLALVLVPISAITTKRVGNIMRRAVRRSLESMSAIYKILQETFQGIKVVKAYTMERHERVRFYRETKNLYRKSVKVASIDAMSDPVLEMLALSTVAIALLSGSYLVLEHTTFVDFGLFKLQLAERPMGIEDLLSLYAMLAGISDPVRKLANVHARIQRAAAASDRICDLMDREPQVVSKADAGPMPRHRKSIAFEGVAFGYEGREPVLKGVDLEVRHGEIVALVGPNGCGKSTLMSLLPRFYDIQEGTIRVDGVDIRDYKLRDLRRQIGFVTQETVLFEDTIANNLSYGAPSLTREKIIEAAKRSYAHGFIMDLPEGYDTKVAERGLSLSGGQRQRLALARVMLRDPAILILDEATSAIDIEDETLIRKAIEQFSRDRTTFIIAHSLSAIQFADRIVLLNNGQVEAAGTDAELRRTSPLYRRLCEIQFRESA